MARWNFKNRKEGSTESKEAEECPEMKNDPRVRSFVRNYEARQLRARLPLSFANREICPQRHRWCRRVPEQRGKRRKGHEPLIRILNKLENEGFQMDVALGKDEFVLPVKKKIILNMLGYGEDL